MIEKSIDKDIYFTITEQREAEITVDKSRFIAEAYSVTTKEQADGILEVVRQKHHDASHHCFSWILGPSGLYSRSSDDGEPKGTAGIPITFMINKYDFKDIIVIVTRYFGGKKLGIGGLSRAYSDAAEDVLILCEKKPLYITKAVQIHCTYEDIQSVKKLLEKYSVNNIEDYRDSIEIISSVPVSYVDEFRNLITSVTKGRAGTILL